MKKQLELPQFSQESEEQEFWDTVNLTDYFEPSDFTSAAFPNLKPTSQPISLRLPNHLLVRVKERANELQVPYQALIKQYISDGVGNK